MQEGATGYGEGEPTSRRWTGRVSPTRAACVQLPGERLTHGGAQRLHARRVRERPKGRDAAGAWPAGQVSRRRGACGPLPAPPGSSPRGSRRPVAFISITAFVFENPEISGILLLFDVSNNNQYLSRAVLDMTIFILFSLNTHFLGTENPQCF